MTQTKADESSIPPMKQFTRRNVLAGGSLASLSTIFPRFASAETNRGKFSIGGLHTEIADRVRTLVDGGSKPVTILYPDGSLANIEPIAERFRQLTGVEILFQNAPLDDINSRIFLSSLTGEGRFDIALPATFGIPDLAQSGAIRNLEDFAQRYEPADFQQTSLYSVGDYYKGDLYGYQTDGDAYVMFYNTRMLRDDEESKRFADRFDRPLTVPATWRELDETMSFFHRPDTNQFGGSLFRIPGYLPWEWWIRFHSKGFFPLDDAMQPQINNDAGIEALDELIASSEFLDPRTKTDGLFDNWKSFAEGNSFCNVGWGGSQKYFNSEASNIRDNLTFGPTPGGIINGELVQMPYFNWGWNYVVSSNSNQPEIAYLFALFACSPAISSHAVAQPDGYFDPFRPIHYEDSRIQEIYSTAFLKTHRQSMANAIPDLYLDGQGEYFDALRTALAAALAGELTPKQALDRAARQWNLTTFKRGKDSQLEQWRFLKSQYPERPQSLLR